MNRDIIGFNSNLKEANYTLYKFPVGTVLTGLSKDISITHHVGSIVLPNTPDYSFVKNRNESLIDLYSTGPDDFVIVDNTTKNIYKENINNIVGMYVDANTNADITLDYLNMQSKRIKQSFGFYYYDASGMDSVIPGIRIKIKDHLCGIKHQVQLIKTEFGKIMFVIDNNTLYDLDRFKSEFDNRTIPVSVRSHFNNSIIDESLDSQIESIFKYKIIRLDSRFKHYMELIDYIVKESYDYSILREYRVSMPTVDIKNCTVTYHFDSVDIPFRITKSKGKNNLTLTYIGDEGAHVNIIPNAEIDVFSKRFMQFMGLSDASELNKFSSYYVSNLGCTVIKDYKQSSGDFNSTIRAIDDGRTANINIKNYIDTVYLYNLINRCRLRENIVMYRGRVSDKSRGGTSFRSLSFSLPVAFAHARYDLKELGIINCRKGSCMMLSNTDLVFSDELEAILNANYELKQVGNGRYVTSKKHVNVTKINNILVDICESIISNNTLAYHLFISNVVNNCIKIEGYYKNFAVDILVGKTEVGVKTDLGNRKFSIDDTLITNINNFLWEYIRNKIYRGMKYSGNGKRTFRVLALNIQSMLTNLCIKHELKIDNKGAAYIRIGNDVFSIYESTGIFVKHGDKPILSEQLVETTVPNMLSRIIEYMLSNLDIDYSDYIQNLLLIFEGKEKYIVKDKNKDKIILCRANGNHNIYLYKQKHSYYIKGKQDKRIWLTLEANKDAYALYQLLHNNGGN